MHMKLTVTKLRVLGVISKNREDAGWCHKGSQHLSNELRMTQPEVQEHMRELLHDGYLQKQTGQTETFVVSVRLTEKAHAERIRLFNECFADIKSMLLSK